MPLNSLKVDNTSIIFTGEKLKYIRTTVHTNTHIQSNSLTTILWGSRKDIVVDRVIVVMRGTSII